MDLYLAITISLWCMGLIIVSQKGMLLGQVRLKLDKWVNGRRDFVISQLDFNIQTLRKEMNDDSIDKIIRLQERINEEKELKTWRDYVGLPLLLCPTCMSSIHGLGLSLIFVVFHPFGNSLIGVPNGFYIIYSIVVSSYFNYILNKFTINVAKP
jgi:hypothetical protein